MICTEMLGSGAEVGLYPTLVERWTTGMPSKPLQNAPTVAVRGGCHRSLPARQPAIGDLVAPRPVMWASVFYGIPKHRPEESDYCYL